MQDVLLYGHTGHTLLTADANPENQEVPLRLSRRGEAFVENLWNGMQTTSQEGSYFIAATATPGTGLTASPATGTTFVDTQAILAIDNLDIPPYLGGQAKRVILDFIAILITAAGTATTSVHVAHRIDGQNRGSAGTQLGATGVNPRASNSDVGSSSIARVLFGNPTVVAASPNVRNMGRNVLRGQIPVVNDLYVIKFGSAEMAAGGVSIGAATASAITVFAAPIIIGPGHSYVLNEWAPARTAAYSAECVVGYVER
jgi:hypothetical protein